MCIYGAYHNISFCLFLYISICLFIKLPDYLLPFPWIYVYRHALTSHDIRFLFYALLDLILILLHRHCSIFRTISRSQFDVIYWSTLPGLWLAGWPSRGRLRRVGCQVQSSRAPSSNLTFPGTVTATRRPSDWPSVTLKSHKITRKTNTGGRCVWNRRGLGVRLPAGLPRRRHDAATTPPRRFVRASPLPCGEERRCASSCRGSTRLSKHRRSQYSHGKINILDFVLIIQKS